MAFGLISAGLSAVGSIAGGLMGRSAARRAAQEQRGGINAAMSALSEGSGDAARILQPYSDEGAGARTLINAALGVPTAQGGISRSGIATDQQVYQNILQDNPALAQQLRGQTENRKSRLYGMSLEQAVKWWVENDNDGQAVYERSKANVAAQQAAQPEAPGATQPEAPGATQADATKVFQGTQYANNAADYTNALFQTKDGKIPTFAASPWQGMADRATTKANDMFLGLAGAQGNVLSGNTARGLQENQANIEDAFYNDYTNAAAASYGANTSAFDKWLASLGGIADTGYAADQTVAGNAVNQGAQVANLATGRGEAAANGVVNSANANMNMLEGVFNAAGQVVGGMGQRSQPQQQPTVNSLYLPGHSSSSSANPARLRNRNMMMAG